MSEMEKDLLALREKERKYLLPLHNVVSIRLTKPQHQRLMTRALMNKTSITEVIRLLLIKGGEHYGFDINQII
jgi:hypothetical protein